MFSFLRFPSRRFFSVLLSPLVFACRASRALGSDVAGGWSCASSVSHFPNDGLHVSFPFGPVTVVGLSFRQRLMLWSDLLDCLLVQTSSWHWYRVAWSWAAREGVVCFFRGWRSQSVFFLLSFLWSSYHGYFTFLSSSFYSFILGQIPTTIYYYRASYGSRTKTRRKRIPLIFCLLPCRCGFTVFLTLFGVLLWNLSNALLKGLLLT